MSSQAAHEYLIDPLVAPNPSEETGPGTHFRSTYGRQDINPTPPTASSPTSSTNPFRRSSIGQKPPASIDARPTSSGGSHRAYPSPPTFTSPKRVHFPSSHRNEGFDAYTDEPPHERRSMEHSSTAQHPKTRSRGMSASEQYSPTQGRTRSRGNSLTERFPGDQSHRPLDMIRKEAKLAQRSPHLKKQHLPGADTVDRLDPVPGGRYHHEGPYDAALLARNTNFENSPVAAVSATTEETLKATPREKVLDSVRQHRPLEGVAQIPAGATDQFGNRYEYEEGEDMMMANGGNYNRWSNGVDYHPDDVKGKGEPAYSIERALKEHRIGGDAEGGYEMTARRRGSTERRSIDSRDPIEIAGGQQQYAQLEEGVVHSDAQHGGVRRNGSNKLADGLKRGIGSLRRRKE